MFKSSQSFQSKARQYSRKGTFADLLVRHVRDRGGDAPSVYTAARIDRRTYSSIVSHPFRPVSKRTAIQFALALHLERPDADALLLAAGYALSPSIPEDIAFAELLDEGEYDMFKVSAKLEAFGFKTI